MQPLACQEIKKQLEETDDSSCRESLLQFITAFSAHMSPAGLEADMRHILVLVLLVGRLDDPDPTLRMTAAGLLIGEQTLTLHTHLSTDVPVPSESRGPAMHISVPLRTREEHWTHEEQGGWLQDSSYAIACRQSRGLQGVCEGADLWGAKAAGVDWLEHCEEGPSSW